MMAARHLILLTWICGVCLCYEDAINLLYKTQAKRVDSEVKRPIRFCKGFEDPSDTDCYMRTDIKTYVCTEPITFNPCESSTRVTVWHYDHIRHRCYQTDVPVCAGNIVRAMTLVQCLIYCHSKDPFALGKTQSIIYKLNQKKPYVAPDDIKKSFVERKVVQNMADMVANKVVMAPEPQAVEVVVEKPSVKADKTPKSKPNITPTAASKKTKTKPEKKSSPTAEEEKKQQSGEFSKSLNGDAELAEFLVKNMKKEVNESEAKAEEAKKEQTSDSQIGGMGKEVILSDSTDKKKKDDGFYLWDE